MKINNKKIIVSTLALAMGAALAGSISGSVAWYQYSTRASAQVAGVSAGTARNLQIKEGTGSYSNHINLGTKNFRPVSYKAGSFYEHPVYKTAQQKEVSTNEITLSDGITKVVAYAEYSFVFKCEDNGVQVAKDIYLTYLQIENTSTGEDVTPAVRIAIDAENDFLVSNAGGDTATKGKLDIGGKEGTLDKDGWDADDVNGNEVEYTTGADKYSTVQPSAVVADATDPYAFNNKSGRLLTTTKESGDSVAVNVKIWLEGWQLFNSSAVWGQEYIAQNFSVNMQFACEAEAN